MINVVWVYNEHVTHVKETEFKQEIGHTLKKKSETGQNRSKPGQNIFPAERNEVMQLIIYCENAREGDGEIFPDCFRKQYCREGYSTSEWQQEVRKS